MDKALRDKYHEIRREDGRTALAAYNWARDWLKQEQTKFTSAFAQDLRVLVPGVGELHFSITQDEYHNPWDDGEAKLIRTGMNEDEARIGAHVRDDLYSTNYWANAHELLCVRFDLAVERQIWSELGYSRANTERLARERLLDVCEWWGKVGRGDVCWVTLCVALHDFEGCLRNEDHSFGHEFFGYNHEHEYLMSTLNDLAWCMVKQRWKIMYSDIPVPVTFNVGVDACVDAALRVWNQTMLLSDNDQQTAATAFFQQYCSSINGGIHER